MLSLPPLFVDHSPFVHPSDASFAHSFVRSQSLFNLNLSRMTNLKNLSICRRVRMQRRIKKLLFSVAVRYDDGGSDDIDFNRSFFDPSITARIPIVLAYDTPDATSLELQIVLISSMHTVSCNCITQIRDPQSVKIIGRKRTKNPVQHIENKIIYI